MDKNFPYKHSVSAIAPTINSIDPNKISNEKARQAIRDLVELRQLPQEQIARLGHHLDNDETSLARQILLNLKTPVTEEDTIAINWAKSNILTNDSTYGLTAAENLELNGNAR